MQITVKNKYKDITLGEVNHISDEAKSCLLEQASSFIAKYFDVV